MKSDRRLKQLEIEREAIKRENDTEKIAQLDKEMLNSRAGTWIPAQVGG